MHTKLRDALAFLEASQRTNSRDVNDWRDDVDVVVKALRAALAQPAASGEAPKLPPGWKVLVASDILRTITVTAPNGYSAVTTNTSRNPENVLRMLVSDLIVAHPPVAPASGEAPERRVGPASRRKVFDTALPFVRRDYPSEGRRSTDAVPYNVLPRVNTKLSTPTPAQPTPEPAVRWACTDCHMEPDGCVVGQCTIGCWPPAASGEAPNSEQQAFEAWCPYRGSPDPRVVWAAAWKAALAAQPPVVPLTDAWRPIETAPRDGSVFLVRIEAEDSVEDDDGNWVTKDRSQADLATWRNSEHGGYVDCFGAPYADSWGATGWLPIPELRATQPTGET